LEEKHVKLVVLNAEVASAPAILLNALENNTKQQPKNPNVQENVVAHATKHLDANPHEDANALSVAKRKIRVIAKENKFSNNFQIIFK
jgi:hypothetical protein